MMYALGLAGGLLLSLTLMGSSRKIFGPDVVTRYLVPHRVDIGVATFFNIGFSALAAFGVLDPLVWGPGGDQHMYSVAVVQLGYLQSLIDRRDFGGRLLLLVLVWLSLAVNVKNAVVTIALEVLSLWVVKLIVPHTGAVAKPAQSRSSKKAKATKATAAKGDIEGGAEEPTSLAASRPRRTPKAKPTRRRSKSM